MVAYSLFLSMFLAVLTSPPLWAFDEESPSLDYCQRHPITNEYTDVSYLYQRVLRDWVVLDLEGSEKDNRLKIAAWRAVCGPELKFFWLEYHKWNIKPNICHYKKNNDGSATVVAEGQLSHHIPFYPDPQHYYGFSWKIDPKAGVSMKNSYLYHSKGGLAKGLQTTLHDPIFYQLFRRGCHAGAGKMNRECPLPQTVEDLEGYLANLRSIVEQAKSEGRSILDALGVNLPGAGRISASNPKEEAIAMAGYIGLSCLAEAKKAESSIGFNSVTTIPSLNEVVEEVVQGHDVVRTKLFGHYWDVGVPIFNDLGSEIEVCGQVTRSQRFDTNDPVSYRFVYRKADLGKVAPTPVKSEFRKVDNSIMVKAISIVDSVVRIIELYAEAVKESSEVPPHLDVLKRASHHALHVASRIKELAEGDWKIAGEELTYALSYMGARDWYRFGARDPDGILISGGACPALGK